MFGLKRKRKTKQGTSAVAPIAPADPGFVEPLGTQYIEFLTAIHAAVAPNWYLEIGSQKGSSLRGAAGRVVAVDPEFKIASDIMGAKSELHLYQMTSDDFFAGGALERMGAKVDMAFLDGMHLFEFLLRDFINTEKNAAPDGLIAMHDCVPRTQVMTLREWDKAVTREWTGDVWKLIPILRQYRPDLRLNVVDCAPTGLVFLTGLDPSNRVLSEAYNDIMAEYMDMSFADFGVQRFFDELNMRAAGPMMEAFSADTRESCLARF